MYPHSFEVSLSNRPFHTIAKAVGYFLANFDSIGVPIGGVHAERKRLSVLVPITRKIDEANIRDATHKVTSAWGRACEATGTEPEWKWIEREAETYVAHGSD